MRMTKRFRALTRGNADGAISSVLQVAVVSTSLYILTGCGPKVERDRGEETPPSRSSPSRQEHTTKPFLPTTPKTEESKLAPEGVFYLKERVTIMTDSGIRGYAAGTKVTRLEDRGGQLLVSDGGSEFEVSKSKVTNDLSIVANLGRSNRQGAKRSQASAQRRSEENVVGAETRNRMAEAEAIRQRSVLRTRIQEIEDRKTRIQQQISVLQEKLEQLRAMYRRKHPHSSRAFQRAWRSSPNRHRYEQQLKSLEASFQSLLRAESQTRSQLQSMR